jgi:capsular polysaccharide export protein
MIRGGLSAFKGKRILLLQGPLGPFFSRLASDLEKAGATVWKINFNGGDWLFAPKRSIPFLGRSDEWPAFFESVLDKRNIDTVLLFGDCRPVHRVAHELAARKGLNIGVFEEGYIRPYYITLEQHGVNAHSRIPRAPEFYLDRPLADVPVTKDIGNMFWYAVFWALTYYLASILLRPLFRHYRHHRPLSITEIVPWMRSAWRKAYFMQRESGMQKILSTHVSKHFFLVPLQVHNDAQIHVHSSFHSVEEFIGRVIVSYAAYAPRDTTLVIKHHPMDRGYHDYAKLIRELACTHGVKGKVLYIHDQHLPTLLDHARGVVLINSTVGLSALHHGTPLKVCGSAIYDMNGLTYQGSLDEFWRDADSVSVNPDLYRRFIAYLIENTQLNGSFYRRLKLPDSCAGLVWNKKSIRTGNGNANSSRPYMAAERMPMTGQDT